MKAKAAPSFCWCDGACKDNFEMKCILNKLAAIELMQFYSLPTKPTSRTPRLERQLCTSRPAHQEPWLNADDRRVRRMTDGRETEVWTEEQDKGDGEIGSEEWGMFCVSSSFFIIWDLTLGAGKGISGFFLHFSSKYRPD